MEERDVYVQIEKIINKNINVDSPLINKINQLTQKKLDLVMNTIFLPSHLDASQFQNTPLAHRVNMLIRLAYQLKEARRKSTKTQILKDIKRVLNYDFIVPSGRPTSLAMEVINFLLQIFPLSKRELSFLMYILNYPVEPEIERRFINGDITLEYLQSRYPQADKEDLQDYINSVHKFMNSSEHPITWVARVFSFEAFQNFRKNNKHRTIERWLAKLKINPNLYRREFKLNPIATMKRVFDNTGYLVAPIRAIKPSFVDITLELGITKKQPKGGFPLFILRPFSKNFEDALLEMLFYPTVDWRGLITIFSADYDWPIFNLFKMSPKTFFENNPPEIFLHRVLTYEQNQKTAFLGLLSITRPTTVLPSLLTNLTNELYDNAQSTLAGYVGKAISGFVTTAKKPWTVEVIRKLLAFVGFEVGNWQAPKDLLAKVIEEVVNDMSKSKVIFLVELLNELPVHYREDIVKYIEKTYGAQVINAINVVVGFNAIEPTEEEKVDVVDIDGYSEDEINDFFK